jgi:all-trans-retinol 13,14-reductase
MKIEELDKWKNTSVEKRGNDYKEWKKMKAEKLLKLVSEQFHQLNNNIDSYYVSTPLTYRDYIGTKDGAMYGIIRDSRNPNESQIMPKTRIPNLLLTGQNINLHGSLGVLISSVVTCGEILGTNELVKQFNEVVNED